MRAWLCLFVGIPDKGTIVVRDEIRFGKTEAEVKARFEQTISLNVGKLILEASRYIYRDITTVVGAEILRLTSGEFTVQEIQQFCHKIKETCPRAEFEAGCKAYQDLVYGAANVPDGQAVVK